MIALTAVEGAVWFSEQHFDVLRDEDALPAIDRVRRLMKGAGIYDARFAIMVLAGMTPSRNRMNREEQR